MFGNGRFVAVGATGEILSSTNGMDWVRTMSTATGNFEDIAYGNGLFVVVGSNQILSSSDGLLWTSRWHPAIRLFSIAAGNGKFVASGTYGEVYTSTDAINWTRVDLRVGMSSGQHRVSLWKWPFPGGGPAENNTGILFSSEDGLNWIQRCIGTNVFRLPVLP